ncbi:MAG: enoyl-CoA hydratase, partial [Calditrichaeota bacterium]|nr:enoyl-CoA hydratase [Calditrichota bacterium]
MKLENILYEVENGVAVVTFNRPNVLNALNNQTVEELAEIVADLENNEDVKGVIITGAGEKAFVAGADIHELSAMDALQGKAFARKGQRVYLALENLTKPVIAAVNGYALGGGCELAMACHIRIASENAVFGQPEVNLGIIPGYGGTQRLPRLIGKGPALEIILSGKMVSAQEAFRLGLVNRVVPADQLMEEARKLVATILSRGP